MAGLLTRHWNSIAARLEAGDLHRPLVEWDGAKDPHDARRGWAAGFAAATSFASETWEDVAGDEEAGAVVDTILGLVADEFIEDAEPLLDPERTRVIDALPVLVRALHAFRRHGVPIPPASTLVAPQRQRFYQPQQPVRVGPKTGRNDPCPCGSGRKYKKCCRAPGAALD